MEGTTRAAVMAGYRPGENAVTFDGATDLPDGVSTRLSYSVEMIGIPLPEVGVSVGSRDGVHGTGMIPVGSGTYTNPGSSSQWLVYGAGASRTKSTALVDISSIRLVYGNFHDQGTVVPSELAGPYPIVVRASVEYPAGVPKLNANSNTSWAASGDYTIGDQVTNGGSSWVATASSTNQTPALDSAYWAQVQFYPAYFRGGTATDVTIQPGHVAVSEPIGINPSIPKGSAFYINNVVQPMSGGVMNQGSFPRSGHTTKVSAGEYEAHVAVGNNNVPDITTATASTVTGDGSPGYAPVAILGVPAQANTPVVYLCGDSIMNGTGDDFVLGSEFGGWGVRLLTDNPAAPTRYLYAHLRSARGSSRGMFQYGPGWQRRLALAAGCTHVIDNWATNDVAAPRTFALMQADALARWTALARMGLIVYASTCVPRTTSTDSWATEANQTPAANFGPNSAWSAYNAWVRTVPSPLTGVIDAAAATADVATGTVWRASYTADGTHPTAAAHIAIAQSVQAVRFFGKPI
ncbi:SGNH/GDSL hydrolase family protein [Parafrankia discariae]|uniref:SGNH/GDSL hydrolase family protein n=1 Tax=Parafrankia discariae TaxID=365528 RepID=UPI0004784ADF|nr:SGNH/GDSL hydrolase family protein [Parafrankia discariae]